MKKIVTLLFVIGCSHFTFADEPPCWCEFSIKSSNHLFRADIQFHKADSLLEPWERKWTIKVYKTSSDSSLLWSSKFYQDGYGGGILSDDGQIYVYVNDWLDMKEPPNQVVIYTPKKILRFSGKDLDLNPDNYSHTASHQIWMDEYKLYPNQLNDSTYLKIKTDDFKEIKIDINAASINNSISPPKFTKENNSLIQLGIVAILLIGVGILFISIWKKRLKKH